MMLLKHPETMSDAEIDAALALEYPPEDFDVHWWWDWPKEKIGFCVSASFRRVMTQEDFNGNLHTFSRETR